MKNSRRPEADARRGREAALPGSEVQVSEVQVEVTIRLGGRTVTTAHRPGMTLLATARTAGLRPPSSCETGSCATCMAQIVRGSAEMRINDALTPDEVAEGWVLTCQAVPTTPVVEVVYE